MVVRTANADHLDVARSITADWAQGVAAIGQSRDDHNGIAPVVFDCHEKLRF